MSTMQQLLDLPTGHLRETFIEAQVARDRFVAACRGQRFDEASSRRQYVGALADATDDQIRQGLASSRLLVSHDQRGELVTVTVEASGDGMSNTMEIPRGWDVERISCGTLTGTPEGGGQWRTGVLADGQKAVGVFRVPGEADHA